MYDMSCRTVLFDVMRLQEKLSPHNVFGCYVCHHYMRCAWFSHETSEVEYHDMNCAPIALSEE